MSRRLLLGGLVVVVVNAAMFASLTHFHYFGRHILVAGLVFAAVAIALRREAARTPLWFIVVVTVAVQLPGLFVHPWTSDDAYRYVWDGRVQLAGIDPYHYVPLDPAVQFLRDPLLFPFGDDRALINRPYVPTIYPPVAQVWFVLVALVTPWSLGTLGVQIGSALAVIATTVLLARFLGPERRGWALLYGACPAVMIEASNGAHLDALAALCVFGLGWAAVRRRHWLAGLFLGLAAGIKLVPLLLVPIFLRRGRWRTSVAGVGLLLAGYVPHVLAVGSLVLGFLPGYLREEGYDGVRRFALFVWLPEAIRAPAALLTAAALAVVALVRSRTEPVLVTCCWLYGCSFLIASPIYAWYALPFVVLVLMAGRLEWLVVWAAMYVAFVFDRETYAQTVAYGLALAWVAFVTVRRRRAAILQPVA
ncbi:MAG TPA: glycosyltransferase family 87 protein [Propionibacteriaceae bacterium]